MLAGFSWIWSAYRIEAASHARKCPTNIPAPDAKPCQERRAYLRIDRSAMPMCQATLQNQAKKHTCQKVNFTRPARGSPPFQITVSARGQKSRTEATPRALSPMMPKARNIRMIQGAATLAKRATERYPQAATTEKSAPMPRTARTQPAPRGA